MLTLLSSPAVNNKFGFSLSVLHITLLISDCPWPFCFEAINLNESLSSFEFSSSYK